MLEAAVRRATQRQRLVLAVSGGRDSMALLHAVARVAPESVAMVAAFDHGTGRHATRAVSLVAADAARLGLPSVVGRADAGTPRTESAWRAARLAFLRDVARRVGARIATAHTRDDQVETVLMRVMRDCGARGLSGLYAGSDVVRPFLDLSRDVVAAWAADAGVVWLDDPSNASPRHLRNRVRQHLIPALEQARPGITSELIASARRAARWRRDVDRVARELASVTATGSATVALAALDRDPGQLAVLWPAIAARIGIAMDRRGIARAVAFTRASVPGARIQLSGGYEIVRTHETFVLARAAGAVPASAADIGSGSWNGWRFAPAGRVAPEGDPWAAWLPSSGRITVRRWQPGDRMRVQSGMPRKVKRFLSDARISGPLRAAWPVVLVDDEIVWIPGVRRAGSMAPERTGDPGTVYRCVPNQR